MTKDNTLTLSNGQTYKVKPVAETLVNLARDGVRKKFIDAGEPVNPPTYTAQIAGGVTETLYHDETTLSSDADKAAWKAHKDALARLDAAQNVAVMKAWFTGIDFELPEDTSWMSMQKWLGIDIPTDTMELRYHYLTTEIFKTANDLLEFFATVNKLSYAGVVSEADLDAAINSFRDNLRVNTSAVVANKAR